MAAAIPEVSMRRVADRTLTYRSVIVAITIFGGLAIAFTVFGVLFGPSEAQIGITRPESSIPTHLLELGGLGVILGLGTAALYGRKGLPLVFLTPVLTVLLDVDHLPAYLGMSQPIRPAHSLVFLASVLVLTGIVIRQVDVDLVVLSAFLGHMGVDTGLFPPFSPFSFSYVQLDPYRVPLLAGAAVASLAAGSLVRRGSRWRKEGT
jgi:hypothetical protein